MFKTRFTKRLTTIKDTNFSFGVTSSDLITFPTIHDVVENIHFQEPCYIKTVQDISSVSNNIAGACLRGRWLNILTNNQSLLSIPLEYNVMYDSNFTKTLIYFRGVTFPDMDSAILENDGEFQIHPDIKNMCAELEISNLFGYY